MLTARCTAGWSKIKTYRPTLKIFKKTKFIKKKQQMIWTSGRWELKWSSHEWFWRNKPSTFVGVEVVSAEPRDVLEVTTRYPDSGRLYPAFTDSLSHLGLTTLIFHLTANSYFWPTNERHDDTNVKASNNSDYSVQSNERHCAGTVQTKRWDTR